MEILFQQVTIPTNGTYCCIEEFKVLAGGANIAHANAAKSSNLAVFLKEFEVLSEFAVKKKFGVSPQVSKFGFTCKKWQIILPMIVSL